MSGLLFLQLLVTWIVLFFLKSRFRTVQVVSLFSLLLNVVLCIYFFVNYFSKGFSWRIQWIGFSAWHVGIELGKIELLMLLLVSIISLLVAIFSYTYMHADKNFHLYFAYLLLFVFAMQMLIVADNFLQTYIFWELVGFCSYLLIGFWREKSQAVRASRKAFLINRIGDIGFLIGIFLIFQNFKTVSFGELEALVIQKAITERAVTWIGICIFFGAMAKSAQVPLHVWLPDAMQGPTPISALLHAATMVAAGVFLAVKAFFLFTPTALQFIQIVGAISMFWGAYKAIFESHIKKVLAYSTVSQLGLMFVAIGAGDREAGLFHLFTHAFFKAGLFLCVGVILYATHDFTKKVPFDNENTYLLGGLRKKLPWVFRFYSIYMASLLGIPFSAGFLSKEKIMETLFLNANSTFSVSIFIVTLVSFGLTAFYIAQQYRALFFGKFYLEIFFPNFKFHFKKNTITFFIPLIALAISSLWIVFSIHPFSIEKAWIFESLNMPYKKSNAILPFMTISATFIGFTLGFQKYWAFEIKKSLFAKKLFFLQLYLARSLQNRQIRKSLLTVIYFFKTFQNSIQMAHGVVFLAYQMHKIDKFWSEMLDNIAKLQVIIAHIIHWIDRALIDTFIHLLVWTGKVIGNSIRQLQGKEIQGYWFFIFTSLLIILWWFVMK